MNDNLINLKQSTQPLNPTVKVIEKSTFYDIYIFFKDLSKEEVIVKHINNFLILTLSLRNKNNDLFTFKRMLYLNKVNIDKLKNTINTNFICLKIPKS